MTSSNSYNIDFDRLIIWLLRTFLRKLVHVAWLGVIITPLKRLHTEFLAFRAASNYKLSHNSQVASMEAVLNDLFDNVQRRIYISNAQVHEPVWFYEPEDNKPVYFYEPEDGAPVYFDEPNALSSADADFIVTVPGEVLPVDETQAGQFENELRYQIDYYKLYSKTYKINYI